MLDKIRFIALPIVLLLIAFVGRLIMGAKGVPYAAANRVFSMVILQVHLALIWGAFSKRYKGYGIGGAMVVGLLIGLTSQILILLGTVGSYLMHNQTYFNYPEALGVAAAVGGRAALKIRLFGLIGNCILSVVAAVLGYFLGGLIPAGSGTTKTQTA
ncbi:MAG TPA: hypothetical protein VGQ81_05920 [Acidobacteriota bacterium]|jgi:hypothetical protein|nr:hypothetical protein [Acidobacteriota bacterium]